jgi:hypothetical protein
VGMRQKISELMKKIIGQWFWVLSAVAAMCLISVILYLFIVHSNVYPIYKDMFRAFSDKFCLVFCFYAVVNAVAIVVGYSMLRKLNILASWKLAVYLVIVLVGNLLIVFLLSPAESLGFLPFVLAVFALLAFFNFAASEAIFALSIREACLIGIIIGLINTLLSIIVTPSYS